MFVWAAILEWKRVGLGTNSHVEHGDGKLYKIVVLLLFSEYCDGFMLDI